MNRRAFTLVEITVAIAVTMVLTTLMLSVLSQSSVIWNRSNESLDTFREARAALQLMAQEIGQVRAMPETQRTFPLLALQYHPSGDPDDRVSNQEIYAVTKVTPHSSAAPAHSEQGDADWCAVGYYSKWIASRQSFSLVRQYTNSHKTFGSLSKVLNKDAPLVGAAAFEELYGRNKVDSKEYVATYIWDLQFVLPDSLQTSDGEQTPGAYPQGLYSQSLPPWIEVRCKALGSLAARRLQGTPIDRNTWTQPNSDLYKKLIRPYQQQFVTRISFAQ